MRGLRLSCSILGSHSRPQPRLREPAVKVAVFAFERLPISLVQVVRARNPQHVVESWIASFRTFEASRGVDEAIHLGALAVPVGISHGYGLSDGELRYGFHRVRILGVSVGPALGRTQAKGTVETRSVLPCVSPLASNLPRFSPIRAFGHGRYRLI